MSGLIVAGARAPEFRLDGSDGRSYALSALLADSLVLLAFYPGNDTPG
jgi:peroxiredoxin